MVEVRRKLLEYENLSSFQREAWTSLPFSKCIKKVKKQPQIKEKDYSTDGIYPIVSQESELVSGFTNDESFVYRHEKPVIIFGDHTRVIKYIDFDFAIGADGTHILSPIDDIHPKFFYYSLLSLRVKSLGYARHFKILKASTIYFPAYKEQEFIVKKLDTAFAKIEQVKEDARKALMEISDIRIAFTNEILLRNPASHPATLGSILKLRRGHDLTHAEMRGGIIPVAGSGGVIGFHDTALGPSPCVTIGRSGSVGKVFYYDFCWPHNTSLYIEDYKGNNPRYLYHLLRNLRAADYRGGAAVPTLNRNNLHPIQVSFCPDIEEQAHISSLFDSLDEKYDVIENNYNDILKECEQLKRSILKSILE